MCLTGIVNGGRSEVSKLVKAHGENGKPAPVWMPVIGIEDWLCGDVSFCGSDMDVRLSEESVAML